MGIVNATPDSFSDGGNLPTAELAIRHGLDLVAQGASIIDVGGESTRPGALRIDAAEEQRRVLPVVAGLVSHNVCVSVDTMRASTAEAAVRAGASTVNDVSGGLADPGMLGVVAETGVDYVVMHWRGHSAVMQSEAVYDDVVDDVLRELIARRDAAVAAGVPSGRIILDPGIGFSKRGEHNWTVLRNLQRFNELGHRLLVGVSRKGFLGDLLGTRPAAERDAATAAVSAWCAQHDVWGVRTHEVTLQRDAILVGSRLGADGSPGTPRGTEPNAVGYSRHEPESHLEPQENAAIDRITLTGLTATGHHGVHPQERRDGQTFVVDVELHLPLDSVSDDLHKTVNYAEVADQVIGVITGEAVDLIETVAGRIADRCLAFDLVREVVVTVHKPHAPIPHTATDLSVTIHRSRHDQRSL